VRAAPATTSAEPSGEPRDDGVSNVSLMPVPSEQPATSCAHCGAALVADQRYCLSCGQPCSPVRLAFLDVLQSDQRSGSQAPPPAWAVPGTIDLGPGSYVPLPPQQGLNGWLRRNSGLLGLLAILLLCLFVGLLVGHWASQSKTPTAPQVVKIEGLGGVAAAGTSTGAAGSGTSTTPSSTAASSNSSSAQASKEAAEGAKEEKIIKAHLPTKTKKVTPTQIHKLSSTTGKKHQEEINALGNEPIEVGGG